MPILHDKNKLCLICCLLSQIIVNAAWNRVSEAKSD